MNGRDETRREFLGKMGMGAAAVSASALARTATAQDATPVKVCMIGNRGHNGYVQDGLEQMPYAKVVGISSASGADDMDKVRKWCASNGHKPEEVDDYRKMMDSLDPDIVTVCGPFELHAEMCVEAFNRGIPVFCEKTVALTLDDLDLVEKAHKKANVHFAAMMGLRYDPAFYTAWQAVQAGAIGEVRMARAQKSYTLGNRAEYYRDRKTYGSSITWVGSHAIDLLYWFVGKEFKTVSAMHTARGNGGTGTMEAASLCQFTMEEDVFSSASIDYLRPKTAPTHGDDRIRVAGTKGVIEVRGEKLYLINENNDGETPLPTSCNKQIFKDFTEQVTGKTKAILTPKDTFAVTKACLLARESADTGQIISFDGRT
jgi:predicted dehydrogenase